MTAVIVNPHSQVVDAVRFSRDSRHHTGCRCFSYRDTHGEAFCTDVEALWNRTINKLIDSCHNTENP